MAYRPPKKQWRAWAFLPDRQEPSERPRLAIIVSCNAGKTSSQSLWKRILERNHDPLGQMLVKKGFVDRVFAPDHDIDAGEALDAARKTLSGRRQLFLDGWHNWAVRVHPLFGVAS